MQLATIFPFNLPMTTPKIPEAYRNHLDHDAKLELIQCKECKTIPGHFAEVKLDNSGYNFLSLSCCSSDGTWFVCCICEVRFARRIKAQKHSQSKKHARLVLSAVECSKKKRRGPNRKWWWSWFSGCFWWWWQWGQVLPRRINNWRWYILSCNR